MAVLFDTLKLAERLEAAGMEQAQARGVAAAIAEAASGEVATRADLAALRTEIAELRSEVGQTRREVEHLREYVDLRLGEAEARLRGEIAGLRTDMVAGDERLRAEIRDVHGRLVWWIIGTGAAAALPIVGLLVTVLVKLIH